MLFAVNRGAGANFNFPDVCLTPAAPSPLPIPYPNFGFTMMAAPFSVFVYVTMMPALNMASMIVMTTGDEGGVAHATFKGMGKFTIGNPIIFIDFMPAVHLCIPTTANNFNAPLGASLIPCAVNVFYCRANDEGEADPGAPEGPSIEALRKLGDVARGSDGEPVSMSVEGRVAHLRIASFPSNVSTLVFRELDALASDAIDEVVIDLRGNLGGDVKAAVGLADDFLARDTPIAQLQFPDGDVRTLRARHDDAYAWPVTALVDGRTASAAEVFAGALQYSGRAALVGDKTYGKAAAQQLVNTESGARYETVATYALPDGTAIQGAGLTPNIG